MDQTDQPEVVPSGSAAPGHAFVPLWDGGPPVVVPGGPETAPEPIPALAESVPAVASPDSSDPTGGHVGAVVPATVVGDAVGDAIAGDASLVPPSEAEAGSPARALTPDDRARLDAFDTSLTQIERGIGELAGSQAAVATEMREIRKLYHTEFAGRLAAMQTELDRYHEADRGRLFDDILTALAKLYTDHEPLRGDIVDPTLAKRISYLFLDWADLLTSHGVGAQKSQPGGKRNPRYCQVVERVPTDDPALHDTVARSRSTGFYIENRPLVKELVDVYIYTNTTAATPAEE